MDEIRVVNASETKKSYPVVLIVLAAVVVAVLATWFVLRGTPNSTASSSTTGSSSTASTPVEKPPAGNVAVQSSWPLMPLVAGNWEEANGSGHDDAGSRIVLDRIIDQSPDEYRDEARSITKLRVLVLPSFKHDTALVEGLITYHSRPALFTVISSQGKIFFMDGSLQPIYELNKANPVDLDTWEHVGAYLRICSAVVSANNGTFKILNSIDDLDWLPSATAEDKQAAAKLIREPAWSNSDAGLKANATVQYGSGISTVVYVVNNSTGDEHGKIQMTDDFSLTAGLPVRTMVFKGPVRYEIGGLN